jgi:hypothetical protein
MHDNDAALSDKARLRLDVGALPRAYPGEMWVDRGIGDVCSLCERILQPVHVVYALSWDRRRYRLHTRCFGAWTAELLRRGWYTLLD